MVPESPTPVNGGHEHLARGAALPSQAAEMGSGSGLNRAVRVAVAYT